MNVELVRFLQNNPGALGTEFYVIDVVYDLLGDSNPTTNTALNLPLAVRLSVVKMFLCTLFASSSRVYLLMTLRRYSLTVAL